MTGVSAFSAWPAVVSACLGGGVFLWAAGLRVIDPREVGWVLRGGDWPTHFLGWHTFRHDAWHWPPGRITSFLEPMGTSLGYTDAIPLVALLLKPFEAALPNPCQYLGLWLLLCFALQGAFGALVLSTWSPRRPLQIVGAMLFVFLPTLASRFGHPALCAHWLLLWALWLYWRPPVAASRDRGMHAALGLTSGLVHPYLAAMTLALLGALLVRRAGYREMPWRRAAGAWLGAAVGVVLGWWTSGLFTLPSVADMASFTGTFSMNLLSPINPGAMPSRFLPGFAAVSMTQLGEGYQYLGFGVLVLAAIAGGVALAKRPGLGRSWPLVAVGLALAAYAVLPVVALERRVLLDVSDLSVFSIFRTTGRFFWPLGYTLVAASAGLVLRDLGGRTAGLVLSAALALQVVDLNRWWREVHYGSRTEAFFAWETPLVSPEWHALLPGYERVRVYYPEYCRTAVAAPMVSVAYLAGLYGLGLNDGFAARVPARRQQEACERLRQDFVHAALDVGTVYLLTPALMADLQARLGAGAACRQIDGVGVCVAAGRGATRERGATGSAPS